MIIDGINNNRTFVSSITPAYYHYANFIRCSLSEQPYKLHIVPAWSSMACVNTDKHTVGEVSSCHTFRCMKASPIYTFASNGGML